MEWIPVKTKSFTGKARPSVQIRLNQNLIIGRFIEICFEATFRSKTNVLSVCKCHFSFFDFEATLSWKTMFWTFQNNIFQFFATFWVTKLKSFSGKARESIKNCSNQNLAIRIFLENGFEAAWMSKANVLSVWKRHFPLF